MRFYIQFLICTIIGLGGLCFALKILFDTLLLTWDPIIDLRDALDPARRRRSVAEWELGRPLQEDGRVSLLEEPSPEA